VSARRATGVLALGCAFALSACSESGTPSAAHVPARTVLATPPAPIPTAVEDTNLIAFLADALAEEPRDIRLDDWWKITAGDCAQLIKTDCGPIGIMICYDSEFPELGCHLTDQGALLFFVPFCTDTREGYLRVRYSAQARAIENQCYVVLSGNVGNLPGVNNFDIQYSQSCILTPCDFPFARDGVAADTSPNVEMVAFADLRLALPALLDAPAGAEGEHDPPRAEIGERGRGSATQRGGGGVPRVRRGEPAGRAVGQLELASGSDGRYRR